jgi:hypothetical protein
MGAARAKAPRRVFYEFFIALIVYSTDNNASGCNFRAGRLFNDRQARKNLFPRRRRVILRVNAFTL